MQTLAIMNSNLPHHAAGRLASVLTALALVAGPAMPAYASSGEGTRREQSAARPGTSGRPSRPGSNGNHGNHRPGKPDRPGHGNSHRPGKPNRPNRPGHPGHPGGWRPGHSAPRPGVGSHRVPRPVYSRPYRPRYERPLPPPPRPRRYISVSAPVIPAVLGLTFGSLINAGLNSLANAGYAIAGAIDNAIYLDNVSHYGYTWPQTTVYYNNGAMNGVRFQYGTPVPGMSRYDSVYRQLCSLYGNPVERTVTDGVTAVTWWGGGGTDYVTLQYGPGAAPGGATQYYTDLIYGY